MTTTTATYLSIDDYRRAEDVPGHRHRPALIYVNDGARETGACVMVDHSDIEFAAVVADAIAAILPDATLAIAWAKQAQAQAEEQATRAHSKRVDAEQRLDHVLHGKRRLFGEALVRVYEDGSAWLLDPIKQERGFGLRFPSLADLWRFHPELRPVRWDGGELIVDATIALG